MHSATVPMLMLWSAADIVTDFTDHFNLAYSGWGLQRGCDNSPISGQLSALSINSTTFSDIYQKGYDMTGVPVDSLIFTERVDHHYQHYYFGKCRLTKTIPRNRFRQ